MNVLLVGYSLFSRLATRAKNALYAVRVLVPKRSNMTVISVGNISLGGSGKTPLAIALLKHFQSRGRKTALISRGYKGRWENRGGMLSDGRELFGSWRDSGDEPFLVARNCPGAGVFVGRHRFESCLKAERLGFETAVLDDGFQHRKLGRDVDIVLFHPQARILREPLSSLGRAHVLLRPEGETPAAKDTWVRQFPRLEVFSYSVVAQGFFRVGCDSALPAKDVRAGRALAFCGIASPRRFFRLLESLGLELARAAAFPDHHPYPEPTLGRIRRWHDELRPDLVVTTEKDAVKLAESAAFLQSVPLVYLKIGLDIERGFWQTVDALVARREAD